MQYSNITPERKKLVCEIISNYFTDKKQRLNEDDRESSDYSEKFVIRKNTPQFGDIRLAQEDMLLKTIGERVTMKEDALVFYPKTMELTLEGHVDALDIDFQFKYPKKDGCYIWANGLQMTEDNVRLISKFRDAFENWREKFTTNDDLIQKLKQAAERDGKYGINDGEK